MSSINPIDVPVDISTEVEEDPYAKVEHIVNTIIRSIDVQERPSREVQVRLWKYLDLLWTGIFNHYWNSGSHQFSPITYDDIGSLSDDIDFDPTLLNKTINLIRPYGESLIGVLTTVLPRVKFFPSNADNVDDIRTAKVSKIIEKRIVDDNQMKVKIIEILVKLWNGGFAASYNYTHKSVEYGEYVEPTYGVKRYSDEVVTCSECGFDISTNSVEVQDREVPDPELGREVGLEDDANLDNDSDEDNIPPPELVNCPSCGAAMTPISESTPREEKFKDGEIRVPKSRQLFKIYGPLHVKIPAKASCMDEVIWLILEEEIHEAKAKHDYYKYWDQIRGDDSNSEYTLDRFARAQYENMGELSQYYVTIRKLWLTPASYPMIGDKEKADSLKVMYPNGLLAVYAGDVFLFCEESVLDDVWTLSFNPLYSRVYGDPLGKALIPLQEQANELFQLQVETVKYAIPQTFADPAIFDFEAYRQSRALPGSVSPLKQSSPGKSISDSFFETKTASLPKEVEALDSKIEELFQFISGVLPSVFGGPSSGSKTLGEYEQSRNQALQRLGIPWLVVVTMYSKMMAKAVKHYRDELLEDEYIVEEKGDSFINTWIRKSDAKAGNVGRVIPEVSEQFPLSWAQKKDVLMNLIQLNNEMLGAWMTHPENIGRIAEYIGIDDLYIPGEDQRNKQLGEIAKIISMSQISPEAEAMMQQQGIDPSMIPPPMIPIEPMIDDSAIHSEIITSYLCSDAGQELKDSNPLAYAGIMLHKQEHDMIVQQQMMAQQAQMQAEAEQNQNQIGESNA